MDIFSRHMAIRTWMLVAIIYWGDISIQMVANTMRMLSVHREYAEYRVRLAHPTCSKTFIRLLMQAFSQNIY